MDEQLILFDEIKPLVITPTPQHDESPMGFVLRTAEMNGYCSINSLYDLAGLNAKEARSARPPMWKMAPIYNRSAKDFKILDGTENLSGRYFRVMQHVLPAIYLRSKHARVCPDCIREHGYASAYWELRHAVACPRHRHMALSECPDCGKTIDWWRRGLTRCSCGYDFADWQGNAIGNNAAIALLELLSSKLKGDELNVDSLAASGFPIKAIQKMSLSTLIGIISRVEHYLDVANTKHSSEWHALETTAELLSQWPHGFHQYLEQVHAPHANMQAKGLRGQFNSVYEAFFKQGLPKDEVEFMHKAFVEFGETRWKQAALHPRMLLGSPSNIVGIDGLAKAIGVMPSTARKLVNTGIIPAHSYYNKNGHKVFDLSAQMPFEFAEGKSLSLDDAAEILDIPATVLRTYRSRGYYQSRHLAIPVVLYHERDVYLLKADLLRDCLLIKISDELRQITFRKVMLKKLGPSEVKAAFIEAVRKRDIKPLGISGSKLGDLVFYAREVSAFIQGLTEKYAGTVSINQASDLLDVETAAIVELMKAGLLDYIDSDEGIRIKRLSLDQFDKEYVSCRAIARLKAITQQDVLKLSKELGIGLLSLDAKGRETMTTFIEKNHISWLGIHLNRDLFVMQAA